MLRHGRLTALAVCGLLSLALLVAACNDTAEAPTMDGAADGETPEGETPDAGEAPDGGEAPDAGEAPDGGEAPDAGETPDDGGGGDGPFTLTAEGFAEGEAIPARHTCDVDDTSPALTWSGAPADTEAFAIVVDDPDAPTAEPFVHFVVYDLPGGETGLEEAIPLSAQTDAGGLQGRNDFGRPGWGGPCPPPGEDHTYVFTLHALNAPLGLEAGATKQQVLDAAEGHVLAQTQLTATYGR